MEIASVYQRHHEDRMVWKAKGEGELSSPLPQTSSLPAQCTGQMIVWNRRQEDGNV